MSVDAHQARLMSERAQNTNGPYYEKNFPVSLKISGRKWDQLNRTNRYDVLNTCNLRVVGRMANDVLENARFFTDVIVCFKDFADAVTWKLRWLDDV